MDLPTKEEIEKLWDEYHVPDNVREHSRQVTKIAVFLAKKLKEKGIHIDVGLVERSSLLHDIARSANFENLETHPHATKEDVDFWIQLKHKYPDTHHGDIAADLLAEKYPEVAEVIISHTIENERESLLDASWEAKVFVYADFRVMHDRIVILAERFADSRKRHGEFYDGLQEKTGIDYRKIIEDNILKVEKEIFEKLDIEPEEINKLK